MKTSQNAKPVQGVKNELASRTVPDQSLSLEQLLTNFTRGQELPQSNKTPAFFDESQYIPNIAKMDLVEIQELMEGNAKNAELLQQRLTELQNPVILPPPPVDPVDEPSA